MSLRPSWFRPSYSRLGRGKYRFWSLEFPLSHVLCVYAQSHQFFHTFSWKIKADVTIGYIIVTNNSTKKKKMCDIIIVRYLGTYHETDVRFSCSYFHCFVFSLHVDEQDQYGLEKTCGRAQTDSDQSDTNYKSSAAAFDGWLDRPNLLFASDNFAIWFRMDGNYY